MNRTVRFFLLCSSWVVAACDNDPRAYDLGAFPDGGDASTDSGPPPDAGSDGPSEASVAAFPSLLSETGLFADMATETLGPGVRTYQPKYALWSDGATKRRWLLLPAGQQIDTSDMDFWKYPVGTKVWKEFTVGGARIETRMLHKTGPTAADWVMIAYQWKADQSDAVAVPSGVSNADPSGHDIPDQTTCHTCHGPMQDALLGVTAIQLSHGLGGVTLSTLSAEGSLTVNPPSSGYTIPGGAVAEQALGYLHANCGGCHNTRSYLSVRTSMELWESTSALSALETTRGYLTTVGQTNSFSTLHTIEPGYPDESALFIRMSSRTPGIQMPPVGTEQVDPAGVTAVRDFIGSLPPLSDAAVPDGGVADGGASDAGPDTGGARDSG